MSRVALVHNPNSTRNLRAAAGALPPVPNAILSPVPGEVELVDCGALADLSAKLAVAHGRGVDILLIDGGDGTVREVLSRVPGIWGAALPKVAILPHGNTNLIAREVGGIRRPNAAAEILRRLESGKDFKVQYRALLRLDYPQDEHPTVRGFIAGWGAYATGTRIAREEIALRGKGQATLATLSTLRRAMIGAERRSLRRGIEARMSVDGAAAVESRRLVGLATTLTSPLIAGINPFWGDGQGEIRWLDIHAPGRWLGVAAPFVVAGRPRGWMKRSGYHSGLASRIELGLTTSLIVDGETFPPGKAGPLILSADEKIGFISL